ncbi:MAG TPA: type II toxin-antitoxin system death-on-curing family toxin [Thermoleophilia bacterium]|nr:type II toxin-antitoxin system death-on-curing family toxin [Thermoleophilia bacterium]
MPAASEPRWVGRLVVDAIHFDLLREHGGMPGLRDEHALESALARPRQRFAQDPLLGLPRLAAAYGFGLVRSHPFGDGNKRTAFVVMGVFLGLNGYEIEATEADVVTVMLNLAAGEVSKEELAAWIGTRLRPSGPT